MKTGYVVAGVVVLLIGGLAYLFLGGSISSMQSGDQAMMEGTQEKESMEKPDAMISGEKPAEPATQMQKSDDAMTQTDSSMMKKDEMGMMPHGGTYEAYAAEKIAWAQNGNVVLFFRASWCPTCKAVDTDIRNNLSAIPKDTTILDVNYDTETALKQKYGVTYQHTFVQVDASGKLIAKWSGSPSLVALLQNIQ